ncbi:MAG: TraR/DksA C4-type zinc finger protein [Patescibacteria group bacterium]|nr:TraR/DksA C4-type zinc finger protein [Patescibacteria group bacterium]
MTHYSQDFIDRCKAALEKLKADTLSELNDIAKYDDDAGSYVATQPDYDVGDVEDPADAGAEAEEYQDRVSEVQDLNKTLDEVNDALAKIENGTYGKCEKSGEWISEERLVAYPAARTCSADM